MKIIDFRIYHYDLPLERPLYVRGQEIPKREGFLIQITSDQGQEGFGEVSPLPGLSHETLEDALKQLKSLQENLLQKHIPEKIEHLDGKFKKWLGEYLLSSCVEFGIEMAVLNLLANSRAKPLFYKLSHLAHNHIRVTALLKGNQSEVTQQALEFKEKGFYAMKLKIGGNLHEDISKVKAVNEMIKENALLYIDANQAYSYEEALTFGREIGCASVAYFEEPFKEIHKIPSFYEETLIPVALDESLSNISIGEIKSINGLEVIVLKPTQLGGLEKTWQTAQQAKRVGLTTVISSSFESGLGILALANLAACSERDDQAGLDTFKWFKKDLLIDPLKIEKGRIDISQRKIQKQDINFKLLTEVK